MALIRQALGSIREPISQEALGELVGFDKYKISRIERGAQDLSRDDAIAIARVDPLGRGPAWLMFGNEGGQSAPLANEDPKTPPANTPRRIQTVERIIPKTIDTRRVKKPGGKDRSAVAG